MKRWLVRILICVALGAMTTVGVAWGASWGAWLWVKRRDFITGTTPTWCSELEAARQDPGELVSWYEVSALGVAEGGVVWYHPEGASVGGKYGNLSFYDSIWCDVYGAAGTLRGYNEVSVARTVLEDRIWIVDLDFGRGILDHAQQGRYGWPMRAMHGTIGGGESSDSPRIIRGVILPFHGGFDILIPLRPLWPGFLIDTLFYGALWLGLIVGLGAARRTLRTRRGLCPMCKYDLRGGLPQAGRLSHRIQGCPECGWKRSSVQLPGDAGG